MSHAVVSRDEWLAARRALLAEEMAFTRARDALAAKRRELPWVKIDKPYVFDGPDGRETLADLFAGRGQLAVYHFMFDPAWEDGCKSCSFWTDNYDGALAHLAARDVTMVAIGRAPYAKLAAFKARMGWRVKFVSSGPSDFNHDFRVGFTPEEVASGEVEYNFARRKAFSTEAPGFSSFIKQDGAVFHAYSCYARGLDMLNGTYQILDVMPKGRDEAGLSYPQAWVKLHDRY